MSRKAFVVTREMRAKVKNLAALGMTEENIARIVGCPVETLRKRFRRELALGPAEANAAAAGYLYAQAKAGNLAAIIFWLKTHGWVTAARKKVAEAARKSAGRSAPCGGTIIVPQNRSMDDAPRIMPVWNEAAALYEKKQVREKCKAQREHARQAKAAAGRKAQADHPKSVAREPPAAMSRKE